MTAPRSKGAESGIITHIAFLRAINVGGHAVVSMKALAAAFKAAGCRDVKTFLQSGNLAFKAAGAKTPAWQEKIQSKLNELLGTETVVIFRTLGELGQMVKADPFRNVAEDPDVKRYVALLAARPHKAPRIPIDSPKDGLTVFRMDNLNVYVLSRRVKKASGSPNLLVEKTFGVPATTRNWSTITKIAKFFEEQDR